jgi:uncharacterized protein (TIGR03086 family)
LAKAAYDQLVAADYAEILELDRRAVELSAQITAQAQPADLARPTPCAGWSLADLLEHMITQHYGFAAASEGHGADLQSWQQDPHDDPIAAYPAAAARVLAAFAAPQTGERAFTLPEISPTLEFPAAQAISFHFIDYVVHSWDVARSLGLPFRLDDDLARAALPVARRVPGGSARLRPGAAFRPGLSVAAAASATDEILAALGRSPDWPGQAP